MVLLVKYVHPVLITTCLFGLGKVINLTVKCNKINSFETCPSRLAEKYERKILFYCAFTMACAFLGVLLLEMGIG